MGKTHESTGEQPHYLSYVMRLWRIKCDQALVAGDEASCPGEVRVHGGVHESIWRASLQDPRTGKRRGFASLDELFAFVRRQTAGACEADNQDYGQQVSELGEDKLEAG